MEHSKLQNWALANVPSDNMIYKNTWWEHIVFIRDKILPMMFYDDACKNLGKKSNDWEKIEKYMSEHYSIVGTHTSKSVKLPVLLLNYKGATIVFRYNFYDYEVTVIYDKDISLPKALFNSYRQEFFYQGFPEKYKIHKNYKDSHKEFSVCIGNSYEFYTLMFLLRDNLDRLEAKRSLIGDDK